jgi:hypothetical protein
MSNGVIGVDRNTTSGSAKFDELSPGSSNNDHDTGTPGSIA